ncbi:MAG: hypothetical protein CW338_06440 [Clostridiales bacterium]|nr:hypothetical protein [Clostridiales bacterium]
MSETSTVNPDLSEHRNCNAGRLLLVAAALLWGLAGVCVKSVTWGSMSQIAARSVLSFLVLLAFKRSIRLKLTRQNVWGALMMSATGMLYLTAITLTSAGTAIVLQYIAPILVFLYNVMFCHRKARWFDILITAAVFGGIILSFADKMDGQHLLGNILGLLSGFTFAAQIQIMSGAGNDSNDSLMLSCIISFVIALPFMFFDDGLTFSATNIIWVLILGIFQYGLANALFGKGIKHVDAVEGSLILTLEPVFNPIPVALLCGEMMGAKAIAGAVIVILGVLVYSLLHRS